MDDLSQLPSIVFLSSINKQFLFFDQFYFKSIPTQEMDKIRKNLRPEVGFIGGSFRRMTPKGCRPKDGTRGMPPEGWYPKDGTQRMESERLAFKNRVDEPKVHTQNQSGWNEVPHSKGGRNEVPHSKGG